MENKYYTIERGQQILVSLLKQHGIKRVVASPGTTNITFVACLQYDPFFEVYSSSDERSAAYLACGMAEETGEPVVLTCTGATASRNYIPALTEAFYRKLPVLAVTATQNENRIGHLVPQMMDRSQQLKDICVHSEHVAVPRDANDEWDAIIRLNRAVLALTHRGGGPVHINLATNYSKDFSVRELPKALCIHRYTISDELPPMPSGRIGILVGSHLPFTEHQTAAIDRFCKAYGALVFCEHGSNYAGEYRVFNAILTQQTLCHKETFKTSLVIHIGEVAGYGNDSCGVGANAVWRVNEDGELRDRYNKLTNVFEMREEDFFTRYADMVSPADNREQAGKEWLTECKNVYQQLHDQMPELPFSNVWLAQQLAHRLPEGAVLHLGILHSMRVWNCFEVPATVRSQSFVNTGGFGIDGCMSSMIGGALSRPDKLHFLVIGDLAFFYDLNVMGNRHVGNNVRILLVNNGKGTEFRNYNHPCARFGDAADEYMAAARHFGNKSPQLIRHFAEDLGFEYLSANNKEELLSVAERWLTPSLTDRPMILEVFTTHEDESDAVETLDTILKDTSMEIKKKVRGILPDKAVQIAKKVIKG